MIQIPFPIVSSFSTRCFLRRLRPFQRELQIIITRLLLLVQFRHAWSLIVECHYLPLFTLALNHTRTWERAHYFEMLWYPSVRCPLPCLISPPVLHPRNAPRIEIYTPDGAHQLRLRIQSEAQTSRGWDVQVGGCQGWWADQRGCCGGGGCVGSLKTFGVEGEVGVWRLYRHVLCSTHAKQEYNVFTLT